MSCSGVATHQRTQRVRGRKTKKRKKCEKKENKGSDMEGNGRIDGRNKTLKKEWQKKRRK
jgi:hypothetical protein